MGVGVVGVGVVQVVGGDDRKLEIAGQAQQVIADAGLDAQAVVHQLEEEIAGPEDVSEFSSTRPGSLVIADAQPGLDLAGRAARRGDEPACVLRQQLAVGARLVEEPLQAGAGRQPEQVVHADGVLGEQGHVGERAAAGHIVLAATRPTHSRAVIA